MRTNISKIVYESIREFIDTYNVNIPVEMGDETPLFGKEGVLDSLGLVSLIVMVEQEIEDNIGYTLILANEKAMSQKNSPFLKVGYLIDYICRLLEEETYV